MKKLLLFLLSIIAACLDSNAQGVEFPDTGVIWRTLHWDGTRGHKFDLKAEADTIVNSIRYVRVDLEGDFGASQRAAYLYRNEGKKVYLRTRPDCAYPYYPLMYDTSEFLLYDFAAQLGDSFTYNSHKGLLVLVVSKIDTVPDVFPKRKMWTLYAGKSSASYPLYALWFEGIGSYDGPFLPLFNGFEISNTFWCLRNRKDSVIFGAAEGCNSRFYGVGINDKQTEKIQLYPNPASNILNVEYPSQIPVRIHIVDLLGKEINAVNFCAFNGAYSLDVSNLPNGHYYLLIEGEKIRRYNFIILH